MIVRMGLPIPLVVVLSLVPPPDLGKLPEHSDKLEHVLAYAVLAAGAVHLHAKITCRLPQIDEDGNEVIRRVETTPGRLRLGALLPKNAKAPFELVNRLLRKKDVQNVIDTVYRYCGQKESVIFCDQIMGMGFREAFRAGISFGKDDMVVPDNKWTIVEEVQDQVKEFEQQYLDGLITQGEKYNKVIDLWSKANDEVSKAMMANLSKEKVVDREGNAVSNTYTIGADFGSGVMIEGTGFLLGNLIGNAIKYTASGEVVVRVNAGSVDVIDSGPGLSAEDAARLFERGYRGTHAEHSQGGGIGLSIVRRLCALYGWDVRVVPGEERGVVASLTFAPGRVAA